MSKIKNSKVQSLQPRLQRVARLHFWYAAAYAGAVIAYDAWKLITPDVVLQRWTLTATLLVVTSAVWYFVRNSYASRNFYLALLFSLITLDILIASLSVYSQRGMASRAVFLYIVPIGVSAILRSRRAIFATATLCLAAYAWTTMHYFIAHPSEGYKIELYGEVGFYSAMFFVVGLLFWIAASRKSQV